MKAGTENRTKTIAAASVGAVALIFFIYQVYNLLGGDSPAPRPATAAPVVTTSASSTRSTASEEQPQRQNAQGNGEMGLAPGVGAKVIAQSSAGLDPTLDEAAMLRTEGLEYSGFGRNIFSAVYTPPPMVIPANVPSARPKQTGPALPPPPPPPPPTCPPSCPPINLKFFGTASFPNGKLQGFFLSGDDVYLAGEGDIVARKYKIESVSANAARVQDLTNTFSQSLALQH